MQAKIVRMDNTSPINTSGHPGSLDPVGAVGDTVIFGRLQE